MLTSGFERSIVILGIMLATTAGCSWKYNQGIETGLIPTGEFCYIYWDSNLSKSVDNGDGDLCWLRSLYCLQTEPLVEYICSTHIFPKNSHAFSSQFAYRLSNKLVNFGLVEEYVHCKENKPIMRKLKTSQRKIQSSVISFPLVLWHPFFIKLLDFKSKMKEL